jgi:cytidylate kinase
MTHAFVRARRCPLQHRCGEEAGRRREMAIITISRELGSGGTEIAESLCSKLGYSKLDKESLKTLLKSFGVTEPQFERDDEKKPGFWVQFTLEKVRYLDFLRAALYRFATEGNCVIIGRGAHIIFRSVPATLKLRIAAPLKFRVARLRERFSVDEQQALHLIRQSDHDRAGYHRYFFDADWSSSSDYDLVVNTAGVAAGEICETVSALVRSPSYAGAGDFAREVLTDLRIAQDVIIAIVYRERVSVMSLDVTCHKGVVALNGTARSQSAVHQCVAVAGTVNGVVRVANNLEVVEYTYYTGLWPS